MKFSKYVGVLDVALISAGNFFVSFMMINFASPSDYGLYVNIFSIMMLFIGFQNALFCTPMTILGAKKSDSERGAFVYNLFIIQSLLLLMISLMICVLCFVFGMSAGGIDGWFCGLLVFLGVSWVTREFFRVRGYLYLKGVRVLVGDVIYSAIIFTVVLAFHYAGDIIYLDQVLLAIVLSSIMAILFLNLSDPIKTVTQKIHIKKTFQESWVGGKWSMVGVSATWSQNNSYAYLISMLINLEATALLAATRLLMMPINMLLSGIYMVFKPQWAKVINSNISLIGKKSLKVLVVMSLFIVTYTLVFALNWDLVSRYLLGGRFVDAVQIFILWGAVFLLQAIRSRYSNLLQLLEEFKFLAVLGLPVAVTSVTVSVICIYAFGLAGCLYGTLLAEVLLIICMVRKFHERSNCNS
jgi:O-antigen/teichoic acid export membrane protein